MFPGRGEKGLEVVLHDAVENRVLGLAPLVRERIGEVVSDEGLARHGRKPMRVACRLPNVRCGREKVAKGPGVLSRSRSRCDDSFTGLPRHGGLEIRAWWCEAESERSGEGSIAAHRQ